MLEPYFPFGIYRAAEFTSQLPSLYHAMTRVTSDQKFKNPTIPSGR